MEKEKYRTGFYPLGVGWILKNGHYMQEWSEGVEKVCNVRKFFLEAKL